MAHCSFNNHLNYLFEQEFMQDFLFEWTSVKNKFHENKNKIATLQSAEMFMGWTWNVGAAGGKTLHVLQSAALTVAHCQKYTRKWTAHFMCLGI